MKVLIVGANSALAKEAITVIGKNNVIVTAGRKDCDIDCDITKDFQIPDDIDVVINFAAAFSGKTDEGITNTVNTNVVGTLNVCIAAKRAGVKQLVLISSIFALLDERSPRFSFYALTKKQADELAKLYCQANNLGLTILRPSQIYGDNKSFEKHQPFLYQIIDKAEKGEDISLYGKNDARRNYIHAADLAEIINRVLDTHTTGIYPCTYPSDVTYRQIATAAQAVFGKGGQVVTLEDKPDVPDNIFENNTTIYEKIGYSPKISIEAGLGRIKAYRGREQA